MMGYILYEAMLIIKFSHKVYLKDFEIFNRLRQDEISHMKIHECQIVS